MKVDCRKCIHSKITDNSLFCTDVADEPFYIAELDNEEVLTEECDDFKQEEEEQDMTKHDCRNCKFSFTHPDGVIYCVENPNIYPFRTGDVMSGMDDSDECEGFRAKQYDPKDLSDWVKNLHNQPKEEAIVALKTMIEGLQYQLLLAKQRSDIDLSDCRFGCFYRTRNNTVVRDIGGSHCERAYTNGELIIYVDMAGVVKRSSDGDSVYPEDDIAEVLGYDLPEEDVKAWFK